MWGKMYSKHKSLLNSQLECKTSHSNNNKPVDDPSSSTVRMCQSLILHFWFLVRTWFEGDVPVLE